MPADCDDVSTPGPTRVKVVATGKSVTTTLTCDALTEAAAANPDAIEPNENAFTSMLSSANVSVTALSNWPGGAEAGSCEGGAEREVFEGGNGEGGGGGAL